MVLVEGRLTSRSSHLSSRTHGKEDTVSTSEPMSHLYSGVKTKDFNEAV
ncbi:hypothetical protein [Salibacterium halotolerans]|nr:hypothetical protein [Salibacterium halotolerans]